MLELFLNNFSINKINILLASTGLFSTLLTAFSAWNYIKINKKWYYLLNFIYILSFIVLILTSNWFIFLLAWEMITITTTLMLLWSNKKITYQYFIIQFIGSSFLFYVIIMAVSSGYTQIGPINETYLQNMFIFGLGMKSAIFGLHFWLAPIHSRAPSPVSAILSGWVVKLGFITYLKLIGSGNSLLIYLGLLMIFYGGIKALLSTDYKVLLAYSSISQLGYIALGIGSGTLYGFMGSIIHIIAHSLAKTGLFVGSGYWIKEYGRSIYNFRAAFDKQRILSISTIISFSSLMGLPLLLGYNSKYLIKHAFAGNVFFLYLLHGVSILTILYSLRFLRWGILKDINITKTRKDLDKNYCTGFLDISSILPANFLLILCGLFPSLLTVIIDDHVYNYHLFQNIFKIIIYFSIAIMILTKLNWLKVKEKEPPSMDMFFEKSILFIRNFCVKSYKVDTRDLFENVIYGVVFNIARWIYIKVFVSFQNQLLWIPVFLILIFIWIMF